MAIFVKEVSRKIKNPVRTKYSKLLKCKCSSTSKDFCIRLDRAANDTTWHMAYGFPFHATMTNEDFASTSKEKLFIGTYASDFNGCPHCGRKVMDFCSCGGIFCAAGDGTGMVKCSVCGVTSYFSHQNEFNVKSSAF